MENLMHRAWAKIKSVVARPSAERRRLDTLVETNRGICEDAKALKKEAEQMTLEVAAHSGVYRSHDEPAGC